MKNRKGFTLIELMLAMSFLAVLMITIAILVIRIIGIYQKGLSIRAVNSTGRQLIDDFSRTIGGSPIPDDVNTGSYAHLATTSYFREYFDSGTVKTASNRQLRGSFCTGSYTYIWHTGTDLNNGNTYKYQYSGGELKDYHLLRIYDPDRAICVKDAMAQNNVNVNTSVYNNSDGTGMAVKTAQPLELLEASEDNLALYDFRVFAPISNYLTGHSFYSATFILATLAGGIDIISQGDYCREPTESLSTDFNYCAINKFNFAMRATGETKGGEDYGQR
jgi:prepilin-type N-terminal cleavage/methylation domain-containing protein